MFLEAQKRFEENSARGQNFSSSYVRDVLRNYGNAGRPIPIKENARADYEAALKFRNAEKQKYAQQAQEFAQMQQRLQSQQEMLFRAQSRSSELQKTLNEHLFPRGKVSDAPPPARRRRGDIDSDSGGGVLPPTRDPIEDDPDAGEPETLISSTPVTHEPPSNGRRRARGHHARPQQEIDKAGGDDGVEADTGRTSGLPTDRAEPDVGGHGGEHQHAE